MVEAEYSPVDLAADPSGEQFSRIQSVYFLLLGSLCVLHYLWFWMMLQKSYREVAGGGGRDEKESAEQKKKA
jgi:hypothetical protein